MQRAGHQRQVGQRLDLLLRPRTLADIATENDGDRPGPTEMSGGQLQKRQRQAGFLHRLLEIDGGQLRLDFGHVLHMPLQESVVGQSLLENDLCQGVGQSDFAAGAVIKKAFGKFGQLHPAHVGNHQLAIALAAGLFDCPVDHRRFSSGIAAENQHRLGGGNAVDAVARPTQTESVVENLERPQSAKTRFRIDIVATDGNPEKLLEKVVLLIGQARRSQAGNRFRADFTKLVFHGQQCFAPANGVRRAADTQPGRGQPLGGIDITVTEIAADT